MSARYQDYACESPRKAAEKMRKRFRLKMKHLNILKLVTMAMFVAIGVVISPILRIEGMCPMAHLINITAAVFLGPLDAF